MPTSTPSPPICSCNAVCVTYMANKGPSKGKRFYRYLMWKEPNSCGLFRWVEEHNHKSVDLKYQLLAIEERIQNQFESMQNKLEISEDRFQNTVNGKLDIVFEKIC